MCGVKPPKTTKVAPDQTNAYLMARAERARAGQGSSTTTNPTGALGVPYGSTQAKSMTAGYLG